MVSHVVGHVRSEVHGRILVSGYLLRAVSLGFGITLGVVEQEFNLPNPVTCLQTVTIMEAREPQIYIF